MTTQPKPWRDLPRRKQDLYLELLWNDGYSESAIATFLGTTKGVVVRRRAILGIKNPEHGRRKRVKSVVNPERFRDLAELERLAVREARGEELVFDGDEKTMS